MDLFGLAFLSPSPWSRERGLCMTVQMGREVHLLQEFTFVMLHICAVDDLVVLQPHTCNSGTPLFSHNM